MRFLGKKQSAMPGWAVTVLLLLAIAAMYAYVEWGTMFKDPDSFYHVKMARLLAGGDIVRHFVWLPFTPLATAFADHHFLYHAMLAPFAAFGDGFVGAKIATVMFGVAAAAALYAFLAKEGVRHAWAYALIAATTSSFMFRMNLTKASSLAVVMSVGMLWLALRGRVLPLAAAAFAYVWLHGSWPVAAFIVAAAVASRPLLAAMEGRPSRAAIGAVGWRQLAAVAMGLSAGLVVNPYFPQNLVFYYEQIVQIAVLGQVGTLPVGAEWYPLTLPMLYVETSAPLLLFAGAVVMLGVAAMSDGVMRSDAPLGAGRSRALIASFLVATAFMVLALRNSRHVEFFVPFMMLFDALLLDSIFSRLSVRRLIAAIGDALGSRKMAAVLVPGTVLLLAYLAFRNVIVVGANFRNGIAWDRYRGAAEWMAGHTDPGSVVAYGKWDSFPSLWYWNDRNRYVIGLDPTFLYRGEAGRYAAWQTVIAGEADISETMRDGLDSGTLMIEKGRGIDYLRSAAVRDPDLRLVYEDDDVWIFASP